MLKLQVAGPPPAKTEYVIWGVPKGSTTDTLLLTQVEGRAITTMADAKKYLAVLVRDHGVKKARIQTIDLAGSFDWLSATGLRR